MGDSLLKDRVGLPRSLSRLLGALADDRDAGAARGDLDADPSPLPAGRMAPLDPRWGAVRRRAGTNWQGNRTHRHPSVPPVPSATPKGMPTRVPSAAVRGAAAAAAALTGVASATLKGVALRPDRPEAADPAHGPAQGSDPADGPDPQAEGARPGHRIDPRFRQRRIQVKREEGRRRLRVLIAATAVLVLIAAALGATRSPLLAARHVRVTGAANTPVAAVLSAGRLTGHPLMIDVHPGRVAAEVDRLPWVRTADVRTSWPDTVTVSIVERTPVAQIASAAGPVLVDSTGRVLAPAGLGASEPPIAVDGGSPPVPAPLAPTPGSEVAAVYAPGLAVAAAMPAALLPYLVRIIVVPGRGLGLQLAGGASATLGDASELPAKLSAVLTLVKRVRIGSSDIDATVPSAPVLTAAGGHA